MLTGLMSFGNPPFHLYNQILMCTLRRRQLATQTSRNQAVDKTVTMNQDRPVPGYTNGRNTQFSEQNVSSTSST